MSRRVAPLLRIVPTAQKSVPCPKRDGKVEILQYHAPSLWTTPTSSPWCRRPLLCVIKSQEMPLNVNVNVGSFGDYKPMEALVGISKHLHRWRTATLRMPFGGQRVLESLAHSASLLEHLSLERHGSPSGVSFNAFKRIAPRLRSARLNQVALPWGPPWHPQWGSGMLSGLEALYLKNIANGPSGWQFTSMRRASPPLSTLKLCNLDFTLVFAVDVASPITLSVLQVLEIEQIDTAVVAHLLSRIKSASCPTIRVHCKVDPDAAQVLQSICNVVPKILLNESHAEVTCGNRTVCYTLRSTLNQTISIELVRARTGTLPVRLTTDSLPTVFLAIDTKATLHIPESSRTIAEQWVAIMNWRDVTALVISGAAGGILKLLAIMVEGLWLFPHLQSVSIAIEDVAQGILAETIKARHSFAQSEIPGPLPFTSVSISDALTDHEIDRAAIESIMGPEVLTWELKEGGLEGTEEWT